MKMHIIIVVYETCFKIADFYAQDMMFAPVRACQLCKSQLSNPDWPGMRQIVQCINLGICANRHLLVNLRRI